MFVLFGEELLIKEGHTKFLLKFNIPFKLTNSVG